MAIEKMNLLNMTFPKDQLMNVLVQLNQETAFYPQTSSKIVNDVKGVYTLKADEEIKKLLERAQALVKLIHFDVDTTKKPAVLDKIIISKKLTELEEMFHQILKNKEELEIEKEENADAYHLLTGLSQSDINLDELKECHYLQSRFGRINKRHREKLDYYQSEPVFFKSLGETSKHIYCVYLANKENIVHVDNVFSSMGFKELTIPYFIHGTVEEATQSVKEELDGMITYIQRADDKIELLKKEHQEELNRCLVDLTYAYSLEEAKRYVVDYQTRYAVYGFLPERCLPSFKQMMRLHQVSVDVLPSEMFDQQDIVAPTLTHNYRWVAPFEVISKVKQEEHVDTTEAFAMLYILVFCLLLGDLGLGAILLLGALIKRHSQIGKLFMVLGIATLMGGILYGDVFYGISLYQTIIPQGHVVERFINAFLLIVTGTYCIRTFKTIYNEKNMMNRVFSLKGIVGIIMTLTIVSYIAISVETHWSINYIPLFIVICVGMVTIFIKKTYEKRKKGKGGIQWQSQR